MKTYFSHQSLNKLDNDVIIINGRKEIYSGTQEQRSVIGFLRPNNMRRCSMLSILPSSNPNCSIYIGNNDNLLVISNFLSKDEDGRLVSYSFYCDEIKNEEEVLSRFNHYCNISEMKVDQRDVDDMKRILFLHNNKKIIYGGSAIIAFFVLLKIIF